jgi:hypothetical protein
MNDPSRMAPARAVRLIFEYEGDQLRLVSQQPVEMAIPGFDLAREEHPAFYVDTRDASDRTLARVIAREAFNTSLEVFPEQPGEPIVRVDMSEPRGAFTVVVPVPANADHVTLLRVDPGLPGEPAPAARTTSPGLGEPKTTDLASFPLSPGIRPAAGGGAP